MPSQSDRAIIRDLASQVAEIAALPHQDRTRSLWRDLNGLRPQRPMVTVDQVSWNEMNVGDELTLLCEDPECKGYETYLRRTLYQWQHFPVDMVVEPFVRVPKAVHNSGFGLEVLDDVARTDETSEVLGHWYHNQFHSMEDVQKVQTPRIWHDEAETARRLELAHQLFDGVLEVRADGVDPYLSVWDPISTWMGVEGALYGLIDQPEMMLALVKRMTDGYLAMLDLVEEQNLVCGPQTLIHCTGAFSDELPQPGSDPARPTFRDRWMFGLAQMFSTVSPSVFREFEVEHASRICARFGLVYYGCCDPLHDRIPEVKLIPHVRKVSMSPWTKQEQGAEAIGGELVFSRKPNPAFLAEDSLDEAKVRADLEFTVSTCARYGCPLELILKDISTVRYSPQKLWRWSEIAMEVVGAR